MTAQAAFLLVTDTGKKKILPAVLSQLLQGLLPLELRVVSGRYNRIECICLLPRNSSHGVLSKTVLTADNQCSLATVNSGENLKVGGTFGNLMYFNPILVFYRAAGRQFPRGSSDLPCLWNWSGIVVPMAEQGQWGSWI